MVVQIICNSREDFPKVGEYFRFQDKEYPVKKVSVSLKMRKMFFVNVVIA